MFIGDGHAAWICACSKARTRDAVVQQFLKKTYEQCPPEHMGPTHPNQRVEEIEVSLGNVLNNVHYRARRAH